MHVSQSSASIVGIRADDDTALPTLEQAQQGFEEAFLLTHVHMFRHLLP